MAFRRMRRGMRRGFKRGFKRIRKVFVSRGGYRL